METVYVETTVVGHLVARIHPNPVISGRQAVTRSWWNSAASNYQLLISQLVIDECSAGDATAAAERLAAIASIDLLFASSKADELTTQLLLGGAIPNTEPRDAYHISIAAVHGVKYLVTWNFKHIANVAVRDRIESICRDFGYEPPLICTPDELSANDDAT